LITAVRTTRVKDTFAKVKAETGECLTDLFTRYIMSFIRKYPTLSTPTCIDFGPARVIVLDLQNVAPTGSAESDRQTEQMYLLGRHILARNFFLHPDYIQDVPERVQAYHAPRFLEIKETLKRLDLDEYQRTKRCRYTREQVVRDVREGRKHNTQVGVTSQISGDYDDELISLSTARFILGAGDEKEAKNIAKLFSLSNAAAAVVEYKLKGPDPKGGGAPFLAIIEADGIRHEQMIVNSLGPVELWALSTTPVDVALRTRLYDRLGPIEARRRLARVFFTGSAKTEIERRKTKRMRGGDDESQAVHGVVDELAHELIDGTGLGIVLRQTESDTALA